MAGAPRSVSVSWRARRRGEEVSHPNVRRLSVPNVRRLAQPPHAPLSPRFLDLWYAAGLEIARDESERSPTADEPAPTGDARRRQLYGPGSGVDLLPGLEIARDERAVKRVSSRARARR